MHDPREEVSHRLARTRLGDGDEVVALQRDGPGLRLDRGRLFVARARHRVHERLGPVTVGEVLHGIGNNDARGRVDGDLVVAAVRGAVLGGAVLEIRHAEASAALIRVGGRGVIVEGAEGLVRAVLLEVSALQVGEVLRGLGGRRAGHGTVVRRLVGLSVPVVRQALRVDLLPRRGEARGRHRALHHRREIKRSGGNRSGAGSRSTRSTGARERARKVRE